MPLMLSVYNIRREWSQFDMKKIGGKENSLEFNVLSEENST